MHISLHLFGKINMDEIFMLSDHSDSEQESSESESTTVSSERTDIRTSSPRQKKKQEN